MGVPTLAHADETSCDPTPTVTFEPHGSLPSGDATIDFPHDGSSFHADVSISVDEGYDSSCSLVTFTLRSWQATGPVYVPGAPQTLYDGDEVSTRDPGTYRLTADVPPCFWQVDLRDIRRDHIVATETGGKSCQSATPSPSETPTPPLGTHTKHHPPKDSVLGETVHPKKKLAFTGSANAPLLALALGLLLAGLGLVRWSARRDT